MAAFDLEEQEQIATLKAWWDKWGNLVTGGAVVLAAVVLGWRGWEYYQTSRSGEASAYYSVLMTAVEKNDAQKVREASGLIAEKFSSTTYGELSALLAAQAQAGSGDVASAKAKLEWAVSNAKDPFLRDLARLRLAAVLFNEKAYDAALKQLDVKPKEPFQARFDDLRGDVLVAQGKPDEARKAYKSAFDLLKDDEGRSMRGLVELKLDALGGIQ